MKKKLFNIVTYTMLFYSIFAAIYAAVPQLQEALPWLTLPTIVVSGGFTGVLGSAGLVVQSFLTKARQEADTQFLGLVDYLEKVSIKINDVLEENKRLRSDIIKSNESLDLSVKRNNELQETHLKIKKDDILIDEKSKQLLEEVLKNEK